MTDDTASAVPPAPPPPDDEALLAECRVDTFRAGGKGGQHQNRTESGVRLVHAPSGITVTARTSRSQHRNLRTALTELRRRLEERSRPPTPRKRTRVPAAEKARRREEKRRRGRTKDMRKPPTPEE
ncbi:MAG: peptide chain release factor-like protein [Gemmatimonadota bacterium]|nr:peptide chain release factor-like protein [Gemmatimonadota bacterium]